MLTLNKTLTAKSWRVFSSLLTTLFLTFALVPAGHTEEEGETQIDVQYVDLKPSFVANFGAPSKKLKFVKADISVRVNSTDAANLVEQHMPLIRNEIVLLLSAQIESEISTMQGQEKVRLEALERIKKVMEEETGSATVEDLLFTNFVLQR